MNWNIQIKNWWGRKAVRGALVIIVVALAGYFIITTNRAEVVEAPTAELPLVTLTTAQQYAGASTINLIGTVRAFSEAAITSEKAGRVTSVRVGLGDTVGAGSVIATLENASEQASVLSAEGVYEAALAAAAQSEVGTAEAATRLRSAQNNAVSVIQNAYNAVESVVYNNIDQFFSNPDGFVPGLRISGMGYTQELNDTRLQFQTKLPTEEARTRVVNTNSNLDAELRASRDMLQETINFIETFIAVFNNQNSSDRYSEADIVLFRTSFNNDRNSLIQLQSQINTALAGLESARDGVTRANLAAAGGTNSAADAQVKQALGSLRSAQANLAKTVIRTPISGTVNSLAVRTGDFINSFAEVAKVANNNALELVTYAGQKDLAVIAIGDSVQIDGRITGIVTEIAPAVDTATGKTEIRIASESEDLQNGDSVKITKQVEESVTTDVIIPLSAVKFALTDGSVFVVADGRLVERPVTLGTIRGGSVEVTAGLDVDEAFVADARGLVAGTEVDITE